MIGGLGVYAIVRVRAGLPLMERVRDGAPPPADVTALSHGAIVVPLERPDAIAEEVMATACRLATETERDGGRGERDLGAGARSAGRASARSASGRWQTCRRWRASLAADYGVDYVGIVRAHAQPGSRDRGCGGRRTTRR